MWSQFCRSCSVKFYLDTTSNLGKLAQSKNQLHGWKAKRLSESLNVSPQIFIFSQLCLLLLGHWDKKVNGAHTPISKKLLGRGRRQSGQIQSIPSAPTRMRMVHSGHLEEGWPAGGQDGEAGCDRLFQEQMTSLKDEYEHASEEEAGRWKALQAGGTVWEKRLRWKLPCSMWGTASPLVV